MSSSVASLPTPSSPTSGTPVYHVPIDVAPRPSSGPQPRPVEPFFFNPSSTNSTRVCYSDVKPNGPPWTTGPPKRLPEQTTGARCCAGAGVWNEAIVACRTETANSTAVFETCANAANETWTRGKCTPYAEYEGAVRSAFWARPMWPEPYDKSKQLVGTAFGTMGGSAGAMCCISHQGNASLYGDRPFTKEFEANLSQATLPCLIPKDEAEKYKECILGAESNVLVVVEAFNWNETKANETKAAEDAKNGAPSRKAGLAFALLAASTALFASVA